jgi:arylsulfatase A-like enzyme
MPRNILFIMCDQLRWDYLSCYADGKLQTPNIDMLARSGVRFTSAYCQAPICGPSRASFYSGRYMSSHGVMANEDATRIDEMMIGDYLRPLGYRSALVGKADNRKDPGMLRAYGVDPDSDYARAAGSGGFEPYELHEGLYPDPIVPEDLAYNRFLSDKGYPGRNPWDEYANSGVAEDGSLLSGWHLRNSRHPARVAAEHSETAFTTDRAMAFLDEQDPDQPWCLHLSYIKPHWPVMAPPPYHNLFGPGDIPDAVRAEEERDDPHPVVRAFMEQEYSQSWSRDEVRACVIPAYMGLIRQIDDELGRLFRHMKNNRQFDNTMIVFTSDHGDYLGDHWLGEKDLFHEPSARVPMIVLDPDQEATGTRGSACSRMVEAIDLLPTLVEFAGGEICRERMEGHSLLPLLRSPESVTEWRHYAVSELDYSDRGPRQVLDQPAYDCRAVMIRATRWKYIHYNQFRPQLFDLQNDPLELNDLGSHEDYELVRNEMQQLLVDSRRRLKPRTGMPFENLAAMGPQRDEQFGIIIGRW